MHVFPLEANNNISVRVRGGLGGGGVLKDELHPRALSGSLTGC